MDLGAFWVSLSVRDLAASQAFYETLGFTPFGGDASQHWHIMKNGSTVIGLFQGMFEGSMLTFNPGWDQDAQPLESFTDVRAVQGALKAAGAAAPGGGRGRRGPGEHRPHRSRREHHPDRPARVIGFGASRNLRYRRLRKSNFPNGA